MMKLKQWFLGLDFSRYVPSAVAFLVCFFLAVGGSLCVPRGVDVDILAAAGIATVSSCLLVAALPLLLGRVSKVLIVPLIAYQCAVVSVKAFLNLFMNMGECDLGVEWVGILLNSSPKEIGEFLSLFCWRKEVLVGAVAILTLLVSSTVFIGRGRCPKWSVKTLVLGLLVASPSVVLYLTGRAYDDALAALLFDVRFNCNVGQGFDQYREIAVSSRNFDFPSSPRYVPRSDSFPVLVIVIGESATRNHWGLYGYGRDTTPEISALADRLTVFRHAEATHPFTATSLKRIFTDATAGEGSRARYAFPCLLKAAGYATTLISAQHHWGQYDGVDAVLFESCGEKVFLSDVRGGSVGYDDGVVPRLRDALAVRRNAPHMVFVHLMGSHFICSDRYPSAFDPFKARALDEGRERRIAEYDNSIAYTDRVLAGILGELRAVDAPAALIYFSDHGESFGNVYRSMSDPDMKDIPLIVWCSDAYRSAAPDVVAALTASADCRFGTDRLLRGLCRLCWLDWDGLKDEYDFLSGEDAPDPNVK